MRMTEAAELTAALGKKYPSEQCQLAIRVPEGPGEQEIRQYLDELKSMGYRAYLRTVAGGDEIVVTDKAGPA